jgi:hypothetical protein
MTLLLSTARAFLDISVRFRFPLLHPQLLKPQRGLDLPLPAAALVFSSTRVLLKLGVEADACLRVRFFSSPFILSILSSDNGTYSQYLRRELYRKGSASMTAADIFEKEGFTWKSSMSRATSLVFTLRSFDSTALFSMIRRSTLRRSFYRIFQRLIKKYFQTTRTDLEVAGFLFETLETFHFGGNFFEILLHLCAQTQIETCKICESWYP